MILLILILPRIEQVQGILQDVTSRNFLVSHCCKINGQIEYRRLHINNIVSSTIEAA